MYPLFQDFGAQSSKVDSLWCELRAQMGRMGHGASGVPAYDLIQLIFLAGRNSLTRGVKKQKIVYALTIFGQNLEKERFFSRF